MENSYNEWSEHIAAACRKASDEDDCSTCRFSYRNESGYHCTLADQLETLSYNKRKKVFLVCAETGTATDVKNIKEPTYVPEGRMLVKAFSKAEALDMVIVDDEIDFCYECGGLGDDYYIDDDGELVCACDECALNGRDDD